MTRRRAVDVDAVWRRLVSLVMDTRDDWRRRVSAATDLPFGRLRALRRLIDGPLTLRELADATTNDAPATTVLVNDLEARGLVVRAPHPTNRRAKWVSLTAEGRAVVARARAVIEHAPDAFADVPIDDVEALSRILDTLGAPPTTPRRPRAPRGL
jgi:DNA-binding MarR family transcriptional regulator